MLTSSTDNNKIDKLSINEFKKKIVSLYGNNILPEIAYYEYSEPVRKDDSKEIKAEKYNKKKEIIDNRTAKLARIESELINELDNLINRIKSARSKYPEINNLYTTGTAAFTVMKFNCNQCGNTVSNIEI